MRLAVGAVDVVMARSFLTICLLLLGFSVGLAGAEAEQAKPKGESPPPVTLRTLITGSCQEIQRYAESVVGTGVIRSATEVQRGSAPSDLYAPYAVK